MRVLVLMALVFSTLMANVTARYDGSYSILKMAEATMSYDDDGHNYSIVIKIMSTGPAKLFSSNRTETVESHGKIVDGILVPDSYTRTRDDDNVARFTVFRFDHAAKVVTRVIDHEDKTTSKKRHRENKYPFYAKDDVLSLYYNFRHYFKENKDKTSLFTTAIGGRKSDGQVHVTIPSGEKLREAKDLIEGASKYYTFNVFAQMMGSENGEFYIGMKDENTVKKVVLKDVVFFGDVIGTLVE